MELYTFQASIHVRPAEALPGPVISLDGQALATLKISPVLLGEPLDCTFEDVSEALSRWERMYVEPDGSFVWVSSTNSERWQVDGNLNELENLLLFVELKGCCPPPEFDRLLGVLGWPQKRLIFQLTREAVFLEEPEFRKWALETTQNVRAAGPPTEPTS